MMKLMRFVLALCVVFLLNATAFAADAIRIGAVVSATGIASFIGDPEVKALQTYAQKVNPLGGVLGQKLEVVPYGDAGEAVKHRTLTSRLVDQNGVVAAIGGSTTVRTLAMVPFIEAADVLGMLMREQYLKTVGSCGATVVAEQSYGVSDVDMTPQRLRVRGTPGVQAIRNTSGVGDTVITRNRAQLGIEKSLFYMTHASASKSYIQVAGMVAEGVQPPVSVLLVGSKLPAGDPQRPVVLGYVGKIAKTAKQPVNAFSGSAYDALMMTAWATERVGGTDSARIRDALEQTKGFVGTAGVVTMSERDHLGFAEEAFRVVEVRSGDWTLVD